MLINQGLADLPTKLLITLLISQNLDTNQALD
jgi:hypothetical protein